MSVKEVKVKRVFHEDEAQSLLMAIDELDRRARYITYLFSTGKLNTPKAVAITTREREAIEWLLPRLRVALRDLRGGE